MGQVCDYFVFVLNLDHAICRLKYVNLCTCFHVYRCVTFDSIECQFSIAQQYKKLVAFIVW
jgi:hypothetical protein